MDLPIGLSQQTVLVVGLAAFVGLMIVALILVAIIFIRARPDGD